MSEKVQDRNGDELLLSEAVELHNGGWVKHDHEDLIKSGCGLYFLNNNSDGDEFIYISSADEWYHEDNIGDYGFVWAEDCDEWLHEDGCCHGYINRRDEGWFSNGNEEIYCEDTGMYYMNSSIAEQHGVYWCDSCDEYRDDENGCDCNDEGSVGSDYDSTIYNPSSSTFKETHRMKYTFGVEWETCKGYVPRDYATSHHLPIKTIFDGSVRGKEYVTGVLHGDTGKRWIEDICHAMRTNGCKVDKSCGLHVHIGGAITNRRFNMLCIILGLQVQEELFNFVPKSRRNNSYCRVIPEKFQEFRLINKVKYPRKYKSMLKLLASYNTSYGEFNDSVNKKTRHPDGRYNSFRYNWLNLNNCSFHGIDTVEFRLHSGTIEANKTWYWVLFCMAFVRFVENEPTKIYKGHIGQGPIVTVPMILNSAYPKKVAEDLINYFDYRTEMFNQ
jgi:hypothetical protein